MAGAPVTTYNLNHLQVAPKGASPVYKDVNYATEWEWPIEQDTETLRADGKVAVTAAGAPEGGGSIGFASIDLATWAVMTGGTTSESGTAGTRITRLSVLGNYNPPSLIIVGWIPNVDGNSTSAGLRVTLPSVKLTMPSGTFGQETWSEMSADQAFVADENNVMLIMEELATAPTFTAGVIPTNLTAPA